MDRWTLFAILGDLLIVAGLYVLLGVGVALIAAGLSLVLVAIDGKR